MKTSFRIGLKIIVYNYIFFLIYNSYYGWNLQPVSISERVCDIIYTIMHNIGLFLFLLPLFIIYKDAVLNYKEKKDGHRDDA